LDLNCQNQSKRNRCFCERVFLLRKIMKERANIK
jgi:hypothetical protein